MSDSDRPIHVLLIEDNQTDVVLVREALKEAGQFVLRAAHRLEEGLRLLQEASFDVVLLDLQLPDSYGIATFKTVSDHARHVPIVVLSGNANDAVALEALEQGAQDYLVKGTAAGELLARTLRYAITRQRLAGALQTSEHRLRVLAEQLPAVLWTTDEQLRFTSSRGGDLAALNLLPDQVVGRTLYDYFDTDNPSFPPIAMHHGALQGESTSADVHWSGHWWHAHVEPLRNSAGDIVGTIGVALDVTDQLRLKRDVEAAHRVQQHLLPSLAPCLPGFDIAGACFPAERCSGDFFDYIPLPGGRLAIVLADVSGHGFGPAIVAAAIRSYLRTAAVVGNRVHEMLALGNRLLVSDGDISSFASVFSVSIDSRTRTFQFASAGHPAYLVRRAGDIQKLQSDCVPIGVLDDEVFPLSRPQRLHRGDILLLASDGVFEARRSDDEFFGAQRALDVVRQERLRSSREIVERLHRAACEFSGSASLDDDMTAVVVKAERRQQQQRDPKSAKDGDTGTWDRQASPG